MKTNIFIFILLVMACGDLQPEVKNVETQEAPAEPDRVFDQLRQLAGDALPERGQYDSLAFLILPLEVSCPSCRDKTIDSLLKYKDRLPENHFIIISATAGLKTMRSYFLEHDAELPVVPGKIILDSTDLAHTLDLYTENPAFYYTANRKAHTKILALPATIRDDLQLFFSGSNNRAATE